MEEHESWEDTMEGAANNGRVTFDLWWGHFLQCAAKASFKLEYEDRDEFVEYFLDGDTPERALLVEMARKEPGHDSGK